LASPLQNRLVGTLILVALAVIILPDVLDGEKAETLEEFESIPLQPQQNTKLQEPQPIPDDVSKKLAERTSQVDESETEATAETAEPLDGEALAETALKAPPREPKEFAADMDAFVIQLGAFSNRQSVEKLVTQLRQKGFAAYSEQAGDLTKLMIGPDTSRNELEKQLTRLNELTGLQGKVVTYKP